MPERENDKNKNPDHSKRWTSTSSKAPRYIQDTVIPEHLARKVSQCFLYSFPAMLCISNHDKDHETPLPPTWHDRFAAPSSRGVAKKVYQGARCPYHHRWFVCLMAFDGFWIYKRFTSLQKKAPHMLLIFQHWSKFFGATCTGRMNSITLFSVAASSNADFSWQMMSQ